LAKLLPSLKILGRSVMQFGSNKALNMAKYEQFAPPWLCTPSWKAL